MSDPKYRRGQNYSNPATPEPFLERLIFNNRAIILIAFFILTLFLSYNAIKIQPDASFERMIPLQHPYIVNMLDNRDDLQNLGNFVRIAVEAEEGDIFIPLDIQRPMGGGDRTRLPRRDGHPGYL